MGNATRERVINLGMEEERGGPDKAATEVDVEEVQGDESATLMVTGEPTAAGVTPRGGGGQVVKERGRLAIPLEDRVEVGPIDHRASRCKTLSPSQTPSFAGAPHWPEDCTRVAWNMCVRTAVLTEKKGKNLSPGTPCMNPPLSTLPAKSSRARCVHPCTSSRSTSTASCPVV